MCGTEIHNEPEIAPVSESSCSCCSTETTAAAPATSTDAPGTHYSLEGLTCGHCVQSVQTAVLAVAGVESVTVDLVAGGTSTLVVSGPAVPDDICSAVAAAGYAVTES